MQIELSIHQIDIKDIEIKTIINEAAKYQPDYISVLPPYVKYVKRVTKNLCNISCPIDFPFGVSCLNARIYSINNAIDNGAKKIDVVIPSHYLINKKYDKIREDIETNLKIVKEKEVKLAYILEYRVFNHYTLTKVCNMLKSYEIDNIYVSTGYMIDNLIDNSIACMYLSKKTGMKTIINGDIWHNDQLKTIISYKPYGIRFKSLHSLKLWNEQNS